MSSPTGSDAGAGPKYSLPERERRWLAEPALLPPLIGPGRLIEDRYIDGTRLRLRAVDGVWKLGKKYEGESLSRRPIVNVYLTEVEHAVLAELPAARLIKRRYRVGGFAVDRFQDQLAGLWLAELEMPDAAALAAIVAPDWCIAEVSDNPRYSGGILARHGAPLRHSPSPPY